MRNIWTAFLLPSLLLGVEGASLEVPTRNPNYPPDKVDQLRDATMEKVVKWMDAKVAAGKNNGCTLEKATVRREWADLSEDMRIEYVAAVTCLMSLPPKAPKDRFPGAMSRFDDFVAYHMTHAQQLHDTIHLFPAHRHFVYVYEQALRNECNYTGYQPYMNYDRYAEDPINSPMFNGNASSMGGNGLPDPAYKGVRQMGRTPNIIASGGGGGCVTEGPFSDMVVRLGPVMGTSPSLPKNPKSDGTGDNPRCLRRDINRNAAMGATAEHMMKLLSETTMNNFYNTLLGTPPPKNDPYPWGIHTAGHYIHAVDPGGDPNTSPGDPVFYFHHGALDRLWWLWQMQDPDTRLNAYPDFSKGTMPSMDMPGMDMPGGGGSGWGKKKAKRQGDPKTANIDLEWLAPEISLMDAMDQLGGASGLYCYIYI